jgi:hypothetical protein
MRVQLEHKDTIGQNLQIKISKKRKIYLYKKVVTEIKLIKHVSQ